jgi:hypothetical protein
LIIIVQKVEGTWLLGCGDQTILPEKQTHAGESMQEKTNSHVDQRYGIYHINR